jgi:hypothetical protein
MRNTILTFNFLIFSFLLMSKNANAQDPNFPIISMGIETYPVANDTSGGVPDLSDSTYFNVQMNVALFDTTVIDQIVVQLSDSGAVGNRLQHTFNWDVFGSTGNGTSYSRDKYNLLLDLGDFKDLLNYYATIRIKRTDGSFTDYINFSR